MPFLPHSSETESIVGIQFGVFSPEEIIRRSVCEITSYSTVEGKLGGLFDPRMGVLENGKTCRTCGQNNHNCPGHFGHYTLARPVYYTQFFKLLMKILRCVCFKCGKMLIDKSRHSHLLKLKGETRWKMVLDACSGTSRCGEDTEDGCGSRQPTKYKEEPVHKIYAEWKDMVLPEDVQAPEGATKDEDGKINLTMPLEPEYVHRLLRRITDEDVEFMGFSRHWCRPDWMVCTVLPIPPPQVRPSVTQDNNQRSEDDLTSKLSDIIKANSTLKKKISEDPKKKAIDEWTNLLQYHVATLVDNDIPGVSPAAQRSGRLLKSLQQRLGSKEGRIRNNLQGKRVEFSARSVITPDPNISVAELGVPTKIAMNLTHPEKVTAFNIQKMYAMIQNGPDVYPGAKTVQRVDGRTISLKHLNGKNIELFEGDIVNRHLIDGDIVLFNRQPSLHRMSMMAHRVKVLPYNTFRLNVFCTAPYNADFDGDEMNAHIPQSVETATELREIAAVPLQIVSPRDSVPIVSVVQDTLVGANRFTRPDVLFSRREAMNLLVHAKRWNGQLPEPVTADPQPMWSGQQLLSALLPAISLQMPNSSFSDSDKKDPNSQNLVKILNGKILQGILDKSVFSKQLIHIMYNDFGPELTVDFLDSLQAMIASFLMNSGFSVGISDLIADDETNQKIHEALSKITGAIEDQILQIHMGLFENSSGRSNQEEFEGKVMGALNKATSEAGKIGLQSLSALNRMTNMVKAGSKGSDTNVSQMIAALGQTAIEGKRVPNGFQQRTLPHFKRFDDSARARGFINSCFIKGLDPDEFFFHAMSGREGLIDTAVKSVTADTKVVLMENGAPKCVEIGPWIDSKIDANSSSGAIKKYAEANMELLELVEPVYIPTMDGDGIVSWGTMTAVTRHDPGEVLYSIKTLGGRTVTVTAAKSLLVWDSEKASFVEKLTPEIHVGDFVPVTAFLSAPPATVASVDMSLYLTISDNFVLNERNGLFLGLFLAEGNVDLETGYVQITNNDPAIRIFAAEWFQSFELSVSIKDCVRGFSIVLARFLDQFVGHGAGKRVPAEAFFGSVEFIRGLLNGYFSSNGSVSDNSIESGPVSLELAEGISMLLTRIGVFATVSVSQDDDNNRLVIGSQWASKFASTVPLISAVKQQKLNVLSATLSATHCNSDSKNDVVLDKIVEITEVSPEKHPRMYDVTVPGTLNFGLANGLQVRDTADTGYMQRQIRVALEDLIAQHDGSVRDTNGNLLQIRYGEDAMNATKLESQMLPLGSMSEEEIRAKFTADGDSRENSYVEAVLADRTMLVEKVFKSKMDKGVKYPVHLERLIQTIRNQFGLNRAVPVEGEEQTVLGFPVVTAASVLDAQEQVLKRTHHDNRLWAALVRFHMAPKTLQEYGYTQPALDVLVEQIVLHHLKSWVEPGQPVGVIAAQSIGEPATQMSCHKDTVCIVNHKTKKFAGKISELVDALLEEKAASVKTIGEDSVVLDLEEDYYVLGVSEAEKTSWRRISQVSRHPANGGLVEVVTRSGRKTTATLSHSFLKRSATGIVPVLGSELTVGTRIPIARSIAEVPDALTVAIQGATTFVLDKELGWFCGMYLADGFVNGDAVSIRNIHPTVEEKMRSLCEKYSWPFATNLRKGRYGPFKDNIVISKDLSDWLVQTFNTNNTKTVGASVYHSNKTFLAGLIRGYFDADGNVNSDRQLIRASSRSKDLIKGINRLLGYFGIFGVMSENRVARNGLASYSVSVLKKFVHTFKEEIGLSLAKKADALDLIVEHLEHLDGAQQMYDSIPELGDILAETGRMLRMPGQSRTYGRWTKKESIGRDTLVNCVADFKDMMAVHVDEEARPKILANIAILESALDADVVWDEIVELNYLDDPKEYVYDFTVPGNDSFMVDDNILVHNTLNSVDYDERIVIAKNGKILCPKIGEFIDTYYDQLKTTDAAGDKIHYFPNNQVYIDLADGDDWKALSCDEDGKMMWTRLEAITRHPVVNADGTDTILEVTLESGRKVKATKAKSFLTLVDGKITPTNGSDLRIGDALPLSASMALGQLTYVDTVAIQCDCMECGEASIGLDEESGRYMGAYLAHGNSHRMQIRNLDVDSVIMDHYMAEMFGTSNETKTLPDWVLQANDSFVRGLIYGYLNGNPMVEIKRGEINISSVSERFITKLALLLTRYNIFGRISVHVSDETVYAFETCDCANFAQAFKIFVNATDVCNKRDRMCNVVWDKISNIREIKPMTEWVYDLTVEKTRNFMLESTVLQRDTFHLAGVAAKSNVTRGVPRLKELLKATRNPKAVELTIPLRRDLRSKKEEARRVAQELEFTLLQDLVTTARIYYDPRDDATLIADDADWLAYMIAYERADAPPRAVQQRVDPMSETEQEAPVIQQTAKSPWILRFELDRERMYTKNITMDDIAFILKSKFAELSTVYTDYNSNQLVFRMRLTGMDRNPIDDLTMLKGLQNKVLTATAIRGVPGLRAVKYQMVSDIVELQDGKYKPFDQYVLTTDGSNFLDVLSHPDVDSTRVISSNVHDIYANLGIEATRAILYKEMSSLFEDSGTSVNYRHVGILCDKICSKGKLMSIDRYGINKNDIGPLAKMSFEQTEDIALRAALFGERDPVLGISANVMLGAPIRAGTSFTEIMLDESAAIELIKTTPEQTATTKTNVGPVAFSEELIDNLLYGVDNTECSPALLKLDAALPPALETIPEEIPDIEIDLIDE
jgi:DNA-directed RNA polymerase beta' subunit